MKSSWGAPIVPDPSTSAYSLTDLFADNLARPTPARPRGYSDGLRSEPTPDGGDLPAKPRIDPVPVVFFTDPGSDLDDEMAMIFARYLIEFNFIKVECVIACLHPSFQRAQLARGTMDMVGLHSVPVGYGTDGGDTMGVQEAPLESEYSYMPSVNSERAFSIETGRTLLYRTLVSAKPRSMHLCIIASLKDVALFLRDNEALFVDKVKEVSIMGGVKAELEDGFLVPDSAHNNTFDPEAAAFFYRRCQELGVPLVVVGRECAYQVPVPRSVYEDLAAIGSPIGWRLRNAQRSSIEGLWRRATAADAAGRKGLPARCDRAWFRETFCGGASAVDLRGPDDHVWDLVISFNMYDTLALIAAVPALREQLFCSVDVPIPRTRRPRVSPRFMPQWKPSRRSMGDSVAAQQSAITMEESEAATQVDPNEAPQIVTHRLIGCSKASDGFASQDAKRQCSALFETAFKTGLELNHHFKSQIILAMQVQPNTPDEFMGLALLRALIELQAVDLLGIVLAPDRRFGSLAPLEAAAAETRTTLHALGMHAVRVLVQHASKRVCQLEELYKTAPQTGVKLVVIHSQTDVAEFVSRSPALFRNKTLCVVSMGGLIACPTEEPSPNSEPRSPAEVRETDHLHVDMNASNNIADMEAATFFTKECQALGVKMYVVSRHIALACRLPRGMYDALERHGGPVGRRVAEAQRASMENLWRQVNLPAGHADRHTRLAARCDAQWFIETFCRDPTQPDSRISARPDECIWPHISSFNVYTPHALLVAVPRIGSQFYRETLYKVNATTHHVIGPNEYESGARDASGLRLFLCRLIFKGVLMNTSYFERCHWVEVEGVGHVDLSDEVPEYVDGNKAIFKQKQASANQTCVTDILNLNNSTSNDQTE